MTKYALAFIVAVVLLASLNGLSTLLVPTAIADVCPNNRCQ